MTGIVLLTGATGFVGRQVLKTLSERDVQVRVIVRPETQHKLPTTNNIESVVTTPDLFSESADWWATVCKGVSTVIHVAWYAEHGCYMQSPRNIDCLIGTLNLAKGAVSAGVERFVGVGTCSEYDVTDGLLSTEAPLRPSTPYAGAKAAVFTALSQWLPHAGIEFAWCRLFYLFGEAEDLGRLAPFLRAKLAAGEPAELTSGSQIRDFLDVRDAGRMITEHALGHRQGPINVCSGVPTTVRQFAEQIADEYGRRDLLRFGTRPDNVFDPRCVVGVPCECLK